MLDMSHPIRTKCIFQRTTEINLSIQVTNTTTPRADVAKESRTSQDKAQQDEAGVLRHANTTYQFG
jgi:hypothetical protein